ncbi:hypothetical protein RB195_012841 [Necator americanus]|uniref:7TM GPCR serpentine receptor class x (Srx) domain-containing protein n=1 Tax=Necator americanus TaxID=51031 RepID=A0ABR1DST2_NECAM
MISIQLLFVLLMYLLGNVLSIVSLYILFTHSGLHRNFRMVVFLLIMFGLLRSFCVYSLAATNYFIETENGEDVKNIVINAFVFAICGFAISSLFLSIERCIAVYTPKDYERYSSRSSLPCITFLITTVLTTVLGYWANKNNENQIPLITVTTAAGFISLIIAITVWVRSKHLWKNRNASLGQRFQIAETNRTSPIYLSISVNESICISAMSVMGLLIIQKENSETMGTSYFIVHLLDACGAWRIIFINFTLIYYSFLARKSQQVVMAHMSKTAQESTRDHFSGLKEMWN